MSDDNDDKGTKFRSMSWDVVHKEVETLSRIAMDSVQSAMVDSGMIPADRMSWLHMTGVAILMMRQSLEVPGVPTDHILWAHEKLLLHELVHGYMEAGPVGVRAMEAQMLVARAKIEQQSPPDDSPDAATPPGCTLH